MPDRRAVGHLPLAYDSQPGWEGSLLFLLSCLHLFSLLLRFQTFPPRAPRSFSAGLGLPSLVRGTHFRVTSYCRRRGVCCCFPRASLEATHQCHPIQHAANFSPRSSSRPGLGARFKSFHVPSTENILVPPDVIQNTVGYLK